MAEKETVISLRHLCKYYGKHMGIEDVTLDVSQGDIFGFIGPNGAGKSTAIRTTMGLIHKTSGSATVFGLDCQTQGQILRQRVGYMPSEIFYYDHMKVRDLLSYSASFYQNSKKGRISELCELLDLDPSRKIEDLSFGNRKKVGIIQCLVHEPDLIILDEPTSGLDPLIQQRFFQLLKDENKKGTTILLSSHILPEVQKLCNRVGIIKNGTMVSIDNMSSILSTSYKKVNFEYKDTPQAPPDLLDGIGNLEINSKEVKFLYRGNISELLAYASTQTLANIWIEDPSLEEIFLHFYDNQTNIDH